MAILRGVFPLGKRDFLLFAVLAFLLAVVGSRLFRRTKIESPRDFYAARYADEDYRETLRKIDLEFRDAWRNASDGPLEPTPDADERQLARRLSLALTGSIPSLEELRALEEQAPNVRLEWWLSHLLEDRRWADYVAERLARAFVGTENGPFIIFRRDIFTNWLAERLYANTPYDEIVRSMVQNEGLWTDTPAVNFVSASGDNNNGNQPDPIRLAGRTTRAFLGVRLDCVQCHDDNLGGPWRQSDFHELAAFFGHVRLQFNGIRESPRENGGQPREYKTKYLKRQDEEVIATAPPFFDELMPSEGSRREQLAHWITHPKNKAFSRAIVNRVWALLYGKPLVEPIDDLPLHGPFPPGLETLANDFVEHQFDVRRLIRLIAGSIPFRRASKAPFEISRAHDRAWAAFPLTRLRPEQVSGGLLQAASLGAIDAESNILIRLMFLAQRGEFVKRYGDKGEDEFVDRGGTVPQRLLLMNGNVTKERTEENFLLNSASRIAVLAPNDENAVETAYLTLLTRSPTPNEMAHFTNRLSHTTGSERVRRLEDLFWVLLNSTEFSWNH